MEELITQTLQLIGDYRIEEGPYITREHLLAWIQQFNENDQLFLLSELNHIFATRYISRGAMKVYLKTQFLTELLSKYTEKYQISDLKKILRGLKILRIQSVEKSQHFIIEIFAEVLLEEYDLELENCGNDEVTGYLYLDDVLFTGTTLNDGLTSFFNDKSIVANQKNLETLRKGKIPLILCLFAVHQNGLNNAVNRLIRAFGTLKIDVIGHTALNMVIEDRKSQVNNSSLGYLFPNSEVPENDDLKDSRLEIEGKVDGYMNENGWSIKLGHFYRPINKPDIETFYTSRESRNRFEKIILQKSVEIYNKAKSDSLKMRPLGNGMKTEKSFGLGAMLFTWRNVPFNTPLVFWYGHNWIPLFARNYTSHAPVANENPFKFFL